MKVIREISLNEMEFWGGGEDTVIDLTRSELETIEEMLEEIYPDGMTETEVNDFFWFERDLIAEWLGYSNYKMVTMGKIIVMRLLENGGSTTILATNDEYRQAYKDGVKMAFAIEYPNAKMALREITKRILGYKDGKRIEFVDEYPDEKTVLITRYIHTGKDGEKKAFAMDKYPNARAALEEVIQYI